MISFNDARATANFLMAGKSQREARWRELSRWICPSRGIFDARTTDSRTERETLRFTHTAAQACLAGASGLTSGMTPRNAAWFKPEFRNAELAELPGARKWLDSIDRLVRNCLASGGFYQAIHAFNMDLIWAGCALIFAEDTGDPQPDSAALRYICPQIGTWAVSRNAAGELGHVCRKLSFSLADLAAIFDESSLCEKSRTLLKKQPMQTRDVYHLVMPADDEGPHPVASYWWEEGGTRFLKTGGYREMPFFYTCWHEGATVYGSGPGDEALADARQMDILERHKLEGLAKIVNPPVAAPSHLKGHCNLAAGAINYVPERTQISPIIELASFSTALPHLRQEIQTVGQRLERSLLASVFTSMPLTQRPAGMSATEFLERKREALQQLGPVISAYEPHVLTPLLFRTLQTLDHNGATEPAPEALLQYPLELTLDFISPMANALRQNSAETTRALFSEVASMVASTSDRSVLDKIDLDQIVDELAAGIGAPGSIIRADMEVAAMRQQRAREEALARQLQLQSMQAQGAAAQADAQSAQARAAIDMAQADAAVPPDESDGVNILEAMAGM